MVIQIKKVNKSAFIRKGSTSPKDPGMMRAATVEYVNDKFTLPDEIKDSTIRFNQGHFADSDLHK